MLDKTLRIINFDDSITGQKNLLSKYENTILDFSNIGPRARFWLNSKAREGIRRRLSDSAKDSLTFLGSGDFHHISEILISQFYEPISVIIFDFHPDWDTSPPRFGCGSWVTEVLKRKNVSKVLLVGVSSIDISSFNIASGNLESLKDDRVEIYPYAHLPTKTFLRKIPDNISIRVHRGIFSNTIYWQELCNKNLGQFFSQILSRIPTKNVYVSIDKDCLKADFALTNWEEGKLSLDELLLMLKLIKEKLDIIGLDIVGDYSDIVIDGIIKKVASYLDHPKKIKPHKTSKQLITLINENTNLKILELFS